MTDKLYCPKCKGEVRLSSHQLNTDFSSRYHNIAYQVYVCHDCNDLNFERHCLTEMLSNKKCKCILKTTEAAMIKDRFSILTAGMLGGCAGYPNMPWWFTAVCFIGLGIGILLCVIGNLNDR